MTMLRRSRRGNTSQAPDLYAVQGILLSKLVRLRFRHGSFGSTMKRVVSRVVPRREANAAQRYRPRYSGLS